VTLVVDASVVVAALVGTGETGAWAEQHIEQGGLSAPSHLLVETANVLRRLGLAGQLSGDAAALAHEDLLALPVEMFGYRPLARRVWELRSAVTAYDACYVALAEALGAPLATCDGRLARAPGLRCRVITQAA